jgi:hypothetical protein
VVGASPVASVSDDPATLWSALAPHLAGQPRVRISRDGGRSYPQRFERNLTDTLPGYPAAVRIFGRDGTCRAIFLDFDSKAAGRSPEEGIDRVLADVRLVTTWLHGHGARWIEDYSPNGGRHVYVPLADPVPFSEARDFVEALGARYRSLDRSPHQNLTEGCMRTPGSPHKRGGHQMLAMSLSMAYDIVRRPNDAGVWRRMTGDLREEMAAARARRTPPPDAVPTEAITADTSTPRGMSRAMTSIATNAVYDAARYKSPSEARQAVLLSAARAGLTLSAVEMRIKQGVWPGLAQFYAKYRSAHRFRTLSREWQKAVTYLHQNGSTNQGKNTDRRSPTSQPNTQGGAHHSQNLRGSDSEHRFIRTWRNALALVETRYLESRPGMARRMILRALGEAAHKSGSRFIEFGVRSLAVASGVDHTTVAAHLRHLRSESGALVALVESGRGTHGDLYMLQVPEQLQEPVQDMPWQKGRLHSLRPVFRELGLPAAFVYEVLEHSPEGLSTAHLVRSTGISRSTVSEALEILAAWNLVSRSSGGLWGIVANTSLTLLAEQFGVMEAVAMQVSRYRAERLLWREWLSTHTVSARQQLLSPGEDYPWELFEPPPEDWTLADFAFLPVS